MALDFFFFFYTNDKFYNYIIGHVAAINAEFRFVFTINLYKMVITIKKNN